MVHSEIHKGAGMGTMTIVSFVKEMFLAIGLSLVFSSVQGTICRQGSWEFIFVYDMDFVIQ